MPYLTSLAKIARDAGLTVVEVDGWKTRGHGPMGTVQTITCHHTANGGAKGNAPSLNVVKTGRPDLSGPLAHFVLGLDGTVYVVAAGLCWHAGASKENRQTNSHAIGIEAEAKGTPGAAGDWPEVQMVAFAKLARALKLFYGLDTKHVLGHKETCAPTGRKTDPSFDMNKFRARIDALGVKREEPEVPFTSKEMDEIAQRTVDRLLSTETKLTLTEAEAAEMSSAGVKRKAGDKVSFRYFVSWGGAVNGRLTDLQDAISKGFATATARKAISETYGDDDVMAAPVTPPAGGVSGMAAWAPMLRHLLILLIGVGLSWVTTVVVPFLSGQTGYGTLLAALISAAVAYFTPLVPSYGVGKPESNLARHATRKPPVPLD